MKIFGGIERFGQKVAKVLPSSIHEMIIMPENATMSRKELCEMVTEVNAQYVEQDEVLSDAVYYYSCVNKTLQICNG